MYTCLYSFCLFRQIQRHKHNNGVRIIKLRSLFFQDKGTYPMSICLVKYLLKYRLITTFVTEIYKRLDYTKRTNFRVAKVKIKLKKKKIVRFRHCKVKYIRCIVLMKQKGVQGKNRSKHKISSIPLKQIKEAEFRTNFP